MPKINKTKCRFCSSEPMSMTALRAHCIQEHPVELEKIRKSLPSVPHPNGLDRGPPVIGLGHEFRKRMGYSGRDGAAPEIPDEK